MSDGPREPALADYKDDCLRNRVPPGDGEFGAVEFVRTLIDLGVDVPWSLEVCNDDVWGQRRRPRRAAADAMRRMLAQARTDATCRHSYATRGDDMTTDLHGTTAIVTGATGGMGRAITPARRCGRRRDRHRSVRRRRRRSARRAPGSVHFVAADVSVADDIAAVVAAALSRTAARLRRERRGDRVRDGAAADCSDDDFERMMRVNVRGVFLSMKHEIAAMLEAATRLDRQHRIDQLVPPQHDQPAYTASKHAVLGLTRSAAYAATASG